MSGPALDPRRRGDALATSGTGGDPVRSAHPGKSGRTYHRRTLADPLGGLALAPPPPTLSLESGERNEGPYCGRPRCGRDCCHRIPAHSLA